MLKKMDVSHTIFETAESLIDFRKIILRGSNGGDLETDHYCISDSHTAFNNGLASFNKATAARITRDCQKTTSGFHHFHGAVIQAPSNGRRKNDTKAFRSRLLIGL